MDGPPRPRPGPGRRLVRVVLRRGQLPEVLTGALTAIRTDVEIPGNAVRVWEEYDADGEFSMVFEHPSFDPVGPGQEPPRLVARLATIVPPPPGPEPPPAPSTALPRWWREPSPH